ncbi:MAG TPA: hypothetical protein VM617_00270 [Thermoanaerobaculia bacterium]|nr:hypothetical protein [Thermoanaerobaculia bacterium]
MPFERSILVVSAVATLAFLGAGLHAFLAPPSDDMRLHILLTLGAVLLIVFPHLWTAIYLLATGRAMRLEPGEEAADAARASRRHLWRALPAMLLASLGAFATIAVGQGILAGSNAPWHHVAAFAATVAFQLWALVAGRRALVANARLLDGLDASSIAAPGR